MLTGVSVNAYVNSPSTTSMQNDPRDIVAVFDEVAEFIEAITTGHPKVPRPVVDHLDRRFHGSAEAQCLCAAPRGSGSRSWSASKLFHQPLR